MCVEIQSWHLICIDEPIELLWALVQPRNLRVSFMIRKTRCGSKVRVAALAVIGTATVVWSAVLSSVRADYVSGLNPKGDNYLSFLSAPGRGPYVELDRLGPDTIVTVLRREGGWYFIRLQDGRTGWAFGRYISPGAPPTAEASRDRSEFTVYVSRLDPKGDNYLSFRSGPGGQPYEELDRLGPNTPATVLTQKGKWSKIRLLDGRVGWS